MQDLESPKAPTADLENLAGVTDFVKTQSLISVSSLAACNFATEDALFNLKGIVDGDDK